MKANETIVGVVLVLILSGLVFGAPKTRREMLEKKRWVAAKLDQSTLEEEEKEAQLVVVGKINHWWDNLVHNQHFHDNAIQLKGKIYHRGLLTHAPREVIVKLPSAGKRFVAKVGVDDKANPAGSVIFSVSVKGKELFKSDVMRVGGAPVPLDVNLDGATEFVIAANDAGDGYNGDHAQWANAKITLLDDTEMWLGELPIMGGVRQEYRMELPFSFTYGGQPSASLLKDWKKEQTARKVDGSRQERSIRFADPKTSLELRCQSIEYLDYPAVEWILYFRNAGKADSAILENLEALDTDLSHDPSRPVDVYHSHGSDMGINDFAPRKTTLGTGEKLSIHSDGTSSVQALPFFNMDTSLQGVIGAIGWSGFWSADFGGGVVQAFRRPDSSFLAARFPLQGLNAEVTITASGHELMENGLRMEIESRPGALVMTYEAK